jgi:hypothetical protein
MKIIMATFCLLLATSLVPAQNNFRSGIFLHHSTGIYIWGPNPDGNSTTTIPQQMHLYNTAHELKGDDSISMNEEWWSPGDNEWATQHQFFEGNTDFTNINDYLEANKILVVKSCFPSSSIEALGQPSDTLDPYYKSVYNYKWHWRHIIKVMENHPERFFAIWTNAPLERASTNVNEARFSKSFCKWAKDSLSKGLDDTYGAFPKNVYVFDFFNKLVDSDGFLPDKFRSSEGDSHPNGAATDLIAPQFVNEIFNAAIAYETPVNAVQPADQTTADIKLFPNPSKDFINIAFYNSPERTDLIIINPGGQKVYSKTITEPSKTVNTIDLSGFSKGIYMIELRNGNKTETKKIVVQ